MQAKPWQMIVIVLGLLVGGGGIAWLLTMGGETVDVSHTIHCVDVETGQIYRIDTAKNPVVLPARHPATGRICLVRCAKEPSGKWAVTGRDRSTLTMLDKDVKSALVLDDQGEVTSPVKDPIEYVKGR